MADDYSQAVVRRAVVQICKGFGWDTITNTALESIVDLAERHVTHIGKRSRRYAEQCKCGHGRARH